MTQAAEIEMIFEISMLVVMLLFGIGYLALRNTPRE